MNAAVSMGFPHGEGVVLGRLRKVWSGSRQVSAGIRPASGGAVEDVLQAFEQDPDWEDPAGLVMVAPLGPGTNPLCLAMDGDRHPMGTTKDSLNLDHLRCGNCDCYLLPLKWVTELTRDPQGRLQPTTRPAVGDNGEETVRCSLTAELWLRANPRTAQAVLGDENASAFLGQASNGLPLPPIPLKEAARRYAASLAPMHAYEQRLSEALSLYRQREDSEKLTQATEHLESCLPLMHSALEAFKTFDRAKGNGDEPRWGEAFKQLAIIYEKQGRFSEALEVCQNAEQAGWRGDWENRSARLRKRLSK